MQPSVLFIREDLSDLSGLQRDLARAKDPLRVVGTADPNRPPCVREGSWVGVVLDLDGPPQRLREVISAVRARCPGVPLLGATAKSTPDVLHEAVTGELSGLVPWPCTAGDLRRALAQKHTEEEPSGRCSGLSTARVVALHAQAREDGVLAFWRPTVDGSKVPTGSIHLEAGQVVHAATGDLVGVGAAREILSWHDAKVRWIPGRVAASRTIVGHWKGLLHPAANEGEPDTGALERAISIAYPEVVEKLSRLSHTPQVIAAFLLRHGEVLSGAAVPGFDEGAMRHAACGLSRVLADVVTAAPPPAEADDGAMLRGPQAASVEPARELQAIAGGVRVVVDRIGPDEAGFQAAVAVHQAAPVSKSLRRLIRQIDRAFHKAIRRARGDGSPVTRVA